MVGRLLARGLLACLILGLADSVWGSLAWGSIGDRLIFELNSTHYTQRQLETYIFLKRVLMVNTGGNAAVRAENWTRSLQLFETDMLIEQEAQRLGGFAPSENMIKTAVGVVDKKISADTSLQQVARHLGVEERTKLRVVGSILRIEAFRRSRDKQPLATAAPSRKEIPQPSPTATGDWIKEIEQRATIRYYEGARAYKSIAPVPESEPREP